MNKFEARVEAALKAQDPKELSKLVRELNRKVRTLREEKRQLRRDYTEMAAISCYSGMIARDAMHDAHEQGRIAADVEEGTLQILELYLATEKQLSRLVSELQRHTPGAKQPDGDTLERELKHAMFLQLAKDLQAYLQQRKDERWADGEARVFDMLRDWRAEENDV
jgi:hypothetical protein